MTDVIKQCDVVPSCVECPRYGDDCDGDKRIEPTDYFCKSQLITCNRVKECNGVCPFEDALKHADKMQTMNEQHTVDHDRDWVIGCIEHDGFIKTDRFDKANQIILDALQTEVVRCKDCIYKCLYDYDDDEPEYYYCALEDRPNRNWSVDDTDYCSWGERREE